MRFFKFCFIFFLMTAPGKADEFLGEYLTYLGYEDTFNSRGVKLTSFGAILAQDRANFHRFGLRHELDTGDPFFTSQAARARLPELYRAGRVVDRYILNNVLSGRGHYVYVRVYGWNGRITRVDVFEGAG